MLMGFGTVKNAADVNNATAKVAKGSVDKSNYRPAAAAGLVEGWCACALFPSPSFRWFLGS